LSSKTTEHEAKKNKKLKRLSEILSRGRMKAPKEEHSINKEDSRRGIHKECITKNIMYSQVSKVLLWSFF
jgi:hypothetical protein